MTLFKILAKLTVVLCFLCTATLAQATIMKHTFTISGSGGFDEIGSGSFTWDNEVIPDGGSLSTGCGPAKSGFASTDCLKSSALSVPANLLSLQMTITGSNIEGPSTTTTFTLEDCFAYDLAPTPDFETQITFSCNNGINTLLVRPDHSAFLNGVPGPCPTKTQDDANKLNSCKANAARPPGVVLFAPVFSRPLNAEAAPTLSQWMLILLALMLGGIGYTAAMKSKES